LHKEQWEVIDDFPAYAVGNMGAISSLRRGEELNPVDNGRGYLQVSLSHHGRVQKFYVHLLVAEYFLDGYSRGDRQLLVAHIDENTYNNDIRNLTIGNTPYREERQKAPTGIEYRGRRVRIRETGEEFHSVRHCADVIGGSFDRIYKVIEGSARSHLGWTYEYVEE
jgi:hypothetical protein